MSGVPSSPPTEHRPEDHEHDEGSAAGIRGPVAWMARNGVAANVLMAVLVAGGLIALSQVKQEVFPEVELDMVSIEVLYPGASPAEVEQSIVLAVEEAVTGIDGVKEVRSAASEGSGLVIVELLLGADKDRALNDIKSAVDRITSFPADAERPVVGLMSNRTQAIALVLYGDLEEGTLRQLGEDARRGMLADPRVTYVEVGGTRDLEISVEVPEHQLREHGLTIEGIAQRIRTASVELPAGGIRTTAGEVLLRTAERRERGAEFGDIGLRARPDGTMLRLRDVATITDGFTEDEREVRFNGQRAVMVSAFRVGDETPLAVSAAVKEYVIELRNALPEGVQVAIWGDQSEMYEQRIDLLMRNARTGLILVLVILGLFLEPRLAIWVTLGIPISFAGALLLFDPAEVSINMISLFAFIVTLGMVVDDAIVVGEAIYKQREDGKKFKEAAILGAREVATPVTFSILTTCIAFMPMLFVPGVMGKFFRVLPIVVIAVLLVSLVESIMVLPAHLSHRMPWLLEKLLWPILKPLSMLRPDKVAAGLEWVIQRTYLPTLKRALRWRYVSVFGVGLFLLLSSCGLIAGGRVHTTFLPKTAGDLVTVHLRMPVGTPIEDTRVVLQQIASVAETLTADQTLLTDHLDEDDLAELGERLPQDGSIVRGLYVDLGTNTSMEPDVTGTGGRFASNLGTVMLYMAEQEYREMTTAELVRQWREEVGELPGVDSLTFTYDVGVQPGEPVNIQLNHEDTDTLEAAALRLAQELESYPALSDIDSGVTVGKEQLDLTLTAQGAALGLTEADLARQVRSAYFGAEAVRQQRGRDELRVYVRRPLDERRSLHDIEQMIIRTPEGGEIPLGLAAHVERGRAYTVIRRTDGRQTISVTADLKDDDANANEIIDRIVNTEVRQLLADVPGLQYNLGGEQERQKETGDSLAIGGMAAILAMYALLAVAFKSYGQPLLVLSAIPFGFIGALWGHIIMGYDLSIMSQMGIVALAGVVVNDSLILIVAINRYREEGMGVWRAALTGGARRFRPILLTSLTTFFGLAPMILETSVQARFLIPMAISLGFGVLFATFIMLLMIPCSYMILEDTKRGVGNFFHWLKGEPEDESPLEPEGPADAIVSDPSLTSNPALAE